MTKNDEQIKVIFLDIDGVLNSREWFEKRYNGNVKDIHEKEYRSLFERQADDIDPYALSLLKNFVDKNDIKVVLSSTWRFLYSISEVSELFNMIGWDMTFLDRTLEANSGHRGEEIKHWLDNTKYNVGKYVIIDDDGDMLDEQKENFVQTKFEIGMTQEHIERMEVILEL